MCCCVVCHAAMWYAMLCYGLVESDGRAVHAVRHWQCTVHFLSVSGFAHVGCLLETSSTDACAGDERCEILHAMAVQLSTAGHCHALLYVNACCHLVCSTESLGHIFCHLFLAPLYWHRWWLMLMVLLAVLTGPCWPQQAAHWWCWQQLMGRCR